MTAQKPSPPRMVMLMNRELRRVPLDFDWPLGKTWEGYLQHLDWPTCKVCGGDGIHELARPISETFYALAFGWNQDEARHRYQWCDKITQDEVNHLIGKGRLPTWVRDDSERGGHFEQLPRSADEVNALNRQPGLDSHDAINRWFLIEYRCKRLGIPTACENCRGHGALVSDEEREEADKWEATEPPSGDGYQLWETTSEGSPISPVFATVAELADWLAEHEYKPATKERMGRNEWLSLIGGSIHGIDVQTFELV